MYPFEDFTRLLTLLPRMHAMLASTTSAGTYVPAETVFDISALQTMQIGPPPIPDLTQGSNAESLAALEGFDLRAAEAAHQNYWCVLSQAIMTDPTRDPTCKARCERAWLERVSISPFTRKPITEALVTDEDLKTEINQYVAHTVAEHRYASPTLQM